MNDGRTWKPKDKQDACKQIFDVRLRKAQGHCAYTSLVWKHLTEKQLLQFAIFLMESRVDFLQEVESSVLIMLRFPLPLPSSRALYGIALKQEGETSNLLQLELELYKASEMGEGWWGAAWCGRLWTTHPILDY